MTRLVQAASFLAGLVVATGLVKEQHWCESRFAVQHQSCQHAMPV